MRSLAILLIPLSIMVGCDPGNGKFGPGAKGGSGKVVDFHFDCQSTDVVCIDAEKVGRRFCETIEIKCAWNCAINNTGYVDEIPQKKTDPAQHVFTFHKKGDECWQVYDVATYKCDHDLSGYSDSHRYW